MASKNSENIDLGKVKVIADILDELNGALGVSCLTLQQTQRALKKDAVTLRVNAIELRETIQELQRMQQSLFAELKKAGVLGAGE